MTECQGLLLGMVIGMILQPFTTQLYHHLKWLWRMRKVKHQLEGETRAQAKARTGEWRDD